VLDGRWKTDIERRLKPVGANLKKAGLRADHLTALGLLMAVAASIAIANGALRVGLVLLALTGIPDALDGAVAKAAGTAGSRGAFFDSVADRVSDALLLGGVSWFLTSRDGGQAGMLPLALLAASQVISYQRAKAESLGLEARGGIMERAERTFALGYGACFGHNETKAISMAILDRALQKGMRDGPAHPAEDPEFVLLHVDGVDSMGFCAHYKMPHYVTFQSDMDRLRTTRRKATESSS